MFAASGWWGASRPLYDGSKDMVYSFWVKSAGGSGTVTLRAEIKNLAGDALLDDIRATFDISSSDVEWKEISVRIPAVSGSLGEILFHVICNGSGTIILDDAAFRLMPADYAPPKEAYSPPAPTPNPAPAPILAPAPFWLFSSSVSASSTTTATAFERLTDTSAHILREDIKYAVNRGLMAPIGASTFAPNMGVTRGYLMSVLAMLSGEDINGQNTSIFSDVAAGSKYESAISWAASLRIISGYGNGIFAPDKGISTQEIAVVLASYCRIKRLILPKINSNSPLHMNSLQAWARDAFIALIQSDVIKANMHPNAIVTRAELAGILRRFEMSFPD
jgi:hypothetical protein